MTLNDKLEHMRKEAVMAYFMVLSQDCLEGREPNPGPRENKVGVLMTQRPH